MHHQDYASQIDYVSESHNRLCITNKINQTLKDV
jgi:hypothetical protein